MENSYPLRKVEGRREVSLRGRHCLSLRDFSPDELNRIFDTSLELKRRLRQGEPHELLRGKSLGMIFGVPSTRTRVSLEVAMQQLGGHALYLGPGETHAGEAESWKMTARVLSSMVDGITYRIWHKNLLELAHNSTVPVINAASEYGHPCQVMADLMTILEYKGKLKGQKYVMYWGSSQGPRQRNVPTLVYDTIYAGAKLGMDMVVACPEGYEPKDEIELARKEAESLGTGGSIEISHDPRECVEEADAIHTKCWNLPEWMKLVRSEEQEMSRSKLWGSRETLVYAKAPAPHVKEPEAYKEWIVDSDLVNHAKKSVIVLHSLPADIGQEITEEVIEGPHSVVIDEAGNRMHAMKGILAHLL